MPPLPLVGCLAVLVGVLAVVLLATSAWLAGILLLVVTLGLLGVLLSALRRRPDSSGARLVNRGTSRLRDGSQFLVSAGQTWWQASSQLIRLRWRRHHLQRELRHRWTPLGEAVHREDLARVEALKAETRELQRALEEALHRESAVLGAAHSQIQRERVPVQSTQVLAPVEAQETTSGREAPSTTEGEGEGGRR